MSKVNTGLCVDSHKMYDFDILWTTTETADRSTK